MFLLKPLLSRQAGGPGRLGSARPCGYVLYKEGGDGGGGRETEGDCEKERGRVQCERGGGGLGQSAAGRQRGLICPKGSSASYAI